MIACKLYVLLWVTIVSVHGYVKLFPRNVNGKINIYLFETQQNFNLDAARNSCALFGGHLPILHTQDDLRFMTNTILPESDRSINGWGIRLGLQKQGSSCDQWLDGTEVNITLPWALGLRCETCKASCCAMYLGGNGVFMDNCSEDHRHVCALDGSSMDPKTLTKKLIAMKQLQEESNEKLTETIEQLRRTTNEIESLEPKVNEESTKTREQLTNVQTQLKMLETWIKSLEPKVNEETTKTLEQLTNVQVQVKNLEIWIESRESKVNKESTKTSEQLTKVEIQIQKLQTWFESLEPKVNEESTKTSEQLTNVQLQVQKLQTWIDNHAEITTDIKVSKEEISDLKKTTSTSKIIQWTIFAIGGCLIGIMGVIGYRKRLTKATTAKSGHENSVAYIPSEDRLNIQYTGPSSSGAKSNMKVNNLYQKEKNHCGAV